MSWLGFTALLYAAAVAFGVFVLRAGRPGSGPVPPYGSLGLYDVAYLAGGPGRLADVALLAAERRGALTLGAEVVVRIPGDAVAAELAAAGQPLTPGQARARLARSAFAGGVGASLAGRGLLTQPRRSPLARAAYVVLGAVPLLGLAGLFAGPAGSVTGETGTWFANLGVWILGAVVCGGTAYALMTHFERIEAPIADQVPGLLWRTARDEAEMYRLGTTVPGGDGLGPVAVIGLDRLPAHGPAQLLRQAAAGEGRAGARGWTEDAWHRAAAARGPLGGATYLESRPPVPPARPPHTGRADHHGGMPWDTAPGAEPYDDSAGAP